EAPSLLMQEPGRQAPAGTCGCWSMERLIMARVRKLVITGLIILLLLVALVFSLNNRTAVSVDFLTYQTPELSLALWLIGALALGAVLGMTVGSLASFRSGQSRRRLKKKLEETEKSLERQRSANVKGI